MTRAIFPYDYLVFLGRLFILCCFPSVPFLSLSIPMSCFSKLLPNHPFAAYHYSTGSPMRTPYPPLTSLSLSLSDLSLYTPNPWELRTLGSAQPPLALSPFSRYTLRRFRVETKPFSRPFLRCV